MPKEEISSTCRKDRYVYKKRIDEFTGNKKKIEQANTEITVYKDIVFWPRTSSG